MFVGICFVVFRVRILIIEFSNDVLFFFLSLLISRVLILHFFCNIRIEITGHSEYETE